MGLALAMVMLRKVKKRCQSKYYLNLRFCQNDRQGVSALTSWWAPQRRSTMSFIRGSLATRKVTKVLTLSKKAILNVETRLTQISTTATLKNIVIATKRKRQSKQTVKRSVMQSRATVNKRKQSGLILMLVLSTRQKLCKRILTASQMSKRERATAYSAKSNL